MTVWLPRPVYWLARKLVPIPCVDVLPYRDSDAGPEVGLIRRIGADGSTPGWALVGGRVIMRESLEEAIVRHVESTLGDGLEIGAVDTSRPLHAAEYSPDGRPGGRIDPNKHAVALSYVLEIDGLITPIGEAVDFEWFPADAIPDQQAFAYSHGSVVAALIGTDARLHRRSSPDETERDATTATIEHVEQV